MSDLPPDPWKTLGVDKAADKSEIRTAYRKLVLKCHPDKVQDATLKAQKQEEFQKVQEAWELLNDDAKLAKYEDQLRKSQQASLKTAANTSVPRSTPTKARYEYDIRTAEPPSSRYKSSYASPNKYNSASPHTRSHEEVPTSRAYPYEDVDKHARRTASYEKPPKRDDEKREKEERRRQRREEEELARFKEKERERQRELEREKEREREREARRAEKKKYERLDKERDRERRRDTEDKSRRHNKPYVEPYAEYADFQMDEPYAGDEAYLTSSRSDKKNRSSSKKYDEPRERERERDRERERERDKSASRRAKSPHVNVIEVPTEQKHLEHFQHAASYISRAGGSVPKEAPAFWKSQTPPDSFMIPVAPTPPPADPEEDSILRAARRAARRPSHEASRSKEKLTKYEIDPSPKGRPIPNLTKSYSTPAPPPESPPRVSRTNTTPHDVSYDRIVPILSRNQTWAAGGVVTDRRAADYEDYYESDEDRRHRRSRRARSPVVETTHHYKVEGGKSSRLDKYAYSGSPTSSRKYAHDVVDGHSPTTYGGFKVKESKSYGPADVKYAEYPPAATASYTYPPHGDSYPVAA
ncbi:hypothetical protein QBC35DRAFT_166816 [Podospora australis]|uniref:J domain-containing protein n=1 Tax=Podospora australis TaxID=1536484 RepID=A0AAN6WZ35_9PEZI|nr:hypothetical protein QBC35DRAFT_166816 [Podospora australis]